MRKSITCNPGKVVSSRRDIYLCLPVFKMRILNVTFQYGRSNTTQHAVKDNCEIIMLRWPILSASYSVTGVTMYSTLYILAV